MKDSLKYWWLVLIKGIILIILSYFIFSHPIGAMVGLAIYIGISLLITGALLVIFSISGRKSEDNWGWKLAEGIIDLIFAFVLLSNPAISAAVFPFIVGFWMMVYGVMLFAGSFKAKKDGDKSWFMNLIGGILTVLFGYLITGNILAGAVTITIWISLGVFIFGVLNISTSLKMKKLNDA